MRKFTFILALAMSVLSLQTAKADHQIVPIDDLQNKLYSNAPCTNTTWGDQFEGHWERLFDNNAATIFHSEYGDNTSVDGLDHYIRVDMGEGQSVQAFVFSFRTRDKNCTVNSPTEIVVEGSNEADGTYDVIATLTGLPTTNSTDYTSDVLTNGNAYRFIRYRVTKTPTMQKDGGGKVFFFISEFGMSKVEQDETEQAKAVFDAAYAAAVEALNEAYNNDLQELPLQVNNESEPYFVWTNQQESSEGPIRDLVDGATNNFFHTNWHGDSDTMHYIEVDLGENNELSTMSFYYTTRSGAQQDYPAGIQVLGSNEKNGEYTQIYNVESGLPNAGGKLWQSSVFSSETAYRYIRFNVTAARKYWHMAEFDLCKVILYASLKEGYQSKQAEYEALLSLYNQHANTADYTAEQYNAAAEAINNAIAATEGLTEEQMAEAIAFFDAYIGKVGYPVEDVILEYKTAIEEATSESEIEAAKQVVYASTDVNLPVAGKAYTLTVVAKNGNKYYLNYTTEGLQIIARAENAELPLTALYGCEANENGGISLKTIDGKYLVYHDKTGQTKVTDANYQGFQDGKDKRVNITFTKIANGNNVQANNNEQLFGLLYWNSLRGHDSNGGEIYGAIVVKTGDRVFDASDVPFFNDNFSSAFLLEEYNSQPVVGGFYNIRSANTYRNYVNTTALIYATNAGNAMKWANDHNGANSNAVWTIEKDGNNYYAKNVHTNMYVNGLGLNETPANVAPSLLGDDQYIIRANGNMLHAQGANNGIASWDCTSEGQPNKSNASAWYIDEVESFGYTLSVSAAEWSTVILGYNAVIPENVTCYAVSSINGDWATLSEVEGILPANTAVFVNAAQGEYTFTYTDNTAEATSMLAGTLYNKNIEPAANARIYVLSMVNGVVGLYPAKVNEEGTVFNNANKAYLEIASASKAIQFNFEGTTGIENVQGADAETVIYDLTGRRVQQMNAAGIYIVNGKKVLVK